MGDWRPRSASVCHLSAGQKRPKHVAGVPAPGSTRRAWLKKNKAVNEPANGFFLFFYFSFLAWRLAVGDFKPDRNEKLGPNVIDEVRRMGLLLLWVF